jgi:hypothetical protein
LQPIKTHCTINLMKNSNFLQNKKVITFLIIFGFIILKTTAQNVGIGATSFTPNSSAMLEVRSNGNKGILIPEVTYAQRNSMSPLPQAAQGLLVFQTDSSGSYPAGYYFNSSTTTTPIWHYFSGTGWLQTGNSGTNPSTTFIGTTDSVNLAFRTNNVGRMLLTVNGSLELIGTNNNTFVGNNAGIANTTGQNNAFFGWTAGYSNTTGGPNAFFGYAAGYHNTSGQMNAFFGKDAGYDDSTGSYNSFVGEGAGQGNTTGTSNTMMGLYAGLTLGAGSYNCAYGSQAGLYNQAYYNSFFGNASGLNTSSGTQNCFFGNSAGYYNTTGFQNTYIGANTDGDVAGDLYNATAIGANTIVTQSNSLILGSGANVGIGNSAPNAALQVTNGDVYIDTNANGLILTDDSGNCWRISIDSSGNLYTTQIACP